MPKLIKPLKHGLLVGMRANIIGFYASKKSHFGSLGIFRRAKHRRVYSRKPVIVFCGVSGKPMTFNIKA